MPTPCSRPPGTHGSSSGGGSSQKRTPQCRSQGRPRSRKKESRKHLSKELLKRIDQPEPQYCACTANTIFAPALCRRVQIVGSNGPLPSRMNAPPPPPRPPPRMLPNQSLEGLDQRDSCRIPITETEPGPNVPLELWGLCSALRLVLPADGSPRARVGRSCPSCVLASLEASSPKKNARSR